MKWHNKLHLRFVFVDEIGGTRGLQKNRDCVESQSWKVRVRTAGIIGVVSGIAISVEAEGCQVSYLFELQVPIFVGMHCLIICLLRKRSMNVVF